MDPDGWVEQNVVAQLLEQQDAILQVAQVSGEGQHDVQDRPRHVHLGELRRRQGRRQCRRSSSSTSNSTSSREWQSKGRKHYKKESAFKDAPIVSNKLTGQL